MGLKDKLLDYIDHWQLQTLMEALSLRLGLSLTLIDIDTGTIIATTGENNLEHFAGSCWPTLVAHLTLLPTKTSTKVICSNGPMLCSRHNFLGTNLALLSGSRLAEDPHPNYKFSHWPAAAELQKFEADYGRIQAVVWQYLEGLIDSRCCTAFAALSDKFTLPMRRSTNLEYYRRLVDLAMTVPNIAAAGLHIASNPEQAKLVALQGEAFAAMPPILPISGIWGQCLRDGKQRPLASLADDPWIPLSLAEQFSSYACFYLPLGLTIPAGAILTLVFPHARDLYDKHSLLFMELIKGLGCALVELAKAQAALQSSGRQMRSQVHLLEHLSGDLPLALTTLEAQLESLWGIKIEIDTFPDKRLSLKNKVTIPLKQAEKNIAYIYADRQDLEELPASVVEMGLAFLAPFLALQKRLAGVKGQTLALPKSLLTPREHQVAKFLAQGESNKTIATALGVSEKTIKTHVSNILRKLRLADRTSIAVWYTKQEQQARYRVGG